MIEKWVNFKRDYLEKSFLCENSYAKIADRITTDVIMNINEHK